MNPTAGAGGWQARRSFNPHPARGPGESVAGVLLAVGGEVSIRTRPEGRVNRAHRLEDARAFGVSIRTRPEGRVNRAAWCVQCPPCWFQSAPGPRAG